MSQILVPEMSIEGSRTLSFEKRRRLIYLGVDNAACGMHAEGLLIQCHSFIESHCPNRNTFAVAMPLLSDRLLHIALNCLIAIINKYLIFLCSTKLYRPPTFATVHSRNLIKVKMEFTRLLDF